MVLASAALVFLAFLTQSVSAKPALKKRALATVYDSCVVANTVALTFDDGPYIYLQQISDLLTNAGAKGTFFFNGNNFDCIYSADSIARVKYAYNAGHLIGSHTWSHADLTTISSAQIEDGMYRMEEAFSRIIGIKPAFMRPPYGSYNDNVRTIASARGQNLALWDQDTGDADGNTIAQSEAVYRNAVNQRVNNMLVLNHETSETTANTVIPYAINLLQSNGYRLVTLAECLGVSPYAAVGVPQAQTSAWTCDGTPDPGAVCSGSQCETGTPVLIGGGGGGTGPTPPIGTGHVIHPGSSATTCLTAASNTNGAAVVVQPCNGSPAQAWTQSGGTLVLYSNKCLDVTNGSTANGVKMQIWSCNAGNVNQQFSVTADHRIAWTNHGKCLDLTGGSLAAGNAAQMWACGNGNPNQVWNII